MVIGKWISQAISTAVDIGVPDQLAKGSRRSNDLAVKAGVSEDGMYRLLRALASLGLCAESAGRRFRLTPMGQLLRRDHADSLAGFARFVGHDCTWRPWGRLDCSVKTGLPAFDSLFGASLFEYFSNNPEAAAVFYAAMTSISTAQARAVATTYNFTGVGTLMDVAGGHGTLLATVLQRHRRSEGYRSICRTSHQAPPRHSTAPVSPIGCGLKAATSSRRCRRRRDHDEVHHARLGR